MVQGRYENIVVEWSISSFLMFDFIMLYMNEVKRSINTVFCARKMKTLGI